LAYTAFRKIGFGPKWEKAASDLPIFGAVHPNQHPFGHFFESEGNAFHCRFTAQF